MTVAITWVSLQLTTVARLVPSQAVAAPWACPKLEPVIVTCVPAEPAVGATAIMFGATGAAASAITDTAVLPLTLPKLAVIVALPTATGATITLAEVEMIAAIELFELFQVTCAVRF